MFQDNRSFRLLEKNGKASVSKRTKHINIRYLFITNRVTQCNVLLVCFQTGDMIGDFMTKPLQRDMFRKFRDQIMGVIPDKDSGPGEEHPGKVKPKKGKEYIFLSLVLPLGHHHRSVLG